MADYSEDMAHEIVMKRRILEYEHATYKGECENWRESAVHAINKLNDALGSVHDINGEITDAIAILRKAQEY